MQTVKFSRVSSHSSVTVQPFFCHDFSHSSATVSAGLLPLFQPYIAFHSYFTVFCLQTYKYTGPLYFIARWKQQTSVSDSALQHAHTYVQNCSVQRSEKQNQHWFIVLIRGIYPFVLEVLLFMTAVKRLSAWHCETDLSNMHCHDDSYERHLPDMLQCPYFNSNKHYCLRSDQAQHQGVVSVIPQVFPRESALTHLLTAFPSAS